jgi:hypothetical protein
MFSFGEQKNGQQNTQHFFRGYMILHDTHVSSTHNTPSSNMPTAALRVHRLITFNYQRINQIRNLVKV